MAYLDHYLIGGRICDAEFLSVRTVAICNIHLVVLTWCNFFSIPTTATARLALMSAIEADATKLSEMRKRMILATKPRKRHKPTTALQSFTPKNYSLDNWTSYTNIVLLTILASSIPVPSTYGVELR